MKKKQKKVNSSAVNSIQRKAMKKFAPIFIIPTFIAFCIGFVYPFLWGIKLSFFKFKTLRFQEFTGLDNFVNALKDESFFRAFKFTTAYTVVTMVLINLIAFGIALALTRKIKGATIFRTVFFMPNLIGGIVLGYIWKIILNGVIYAFWHSQLALNATYGFWGLVILMCWQQVGYMMIIYIAGLQNVSTDYIEAAKIDGATSGQILRKITIPCIMPTITICTFLTLTNSFKLFDQNLALTNGYPYEGTIGTTQMLALNIYSSFYENLTSLGVGQAKAVIFFLTVGIISLVQLAFTRSKEVQE
ncbi:MAG: sugar ABC transporter permease [Agathobacter sp.]|nr:sugar ABC transporter permease [Agathobacter sp.]